MRVPTLDPQLALNPLPGVRNNSEASPMSYGYGFGQNLEQAGNAVHSYYMEEKRKAQDTAYRDASNKAAAVDTQLMVPALRTRGRGAFGLLDTVLPDYDKQIDKIGEGIDDQAVRERFQLDAAARRNNIDRALQQHMGEQRQVYDDQVFQDGITTSQQAVGMYYQDEGRVNAELDRQTNDVEAYAQRNNLPPEWTQATKAKVLSQSHTLVLNRIMADDKDIAARDYFERYKAELTPEAQVDALKALDISSTRGESQRQSAKIFSTDKPLDQMLDEARQIKDPKLQDATVQRISELNNLYQQAKRQTEDKAFNQAYAALVDPDNSDGIRGIPAPVMSVLPAQRQNELASYAATMTKREQPKTDWAEYYKLQALASSEATRDAFINHTNLLDSRASLADPEWKELVKLQSDMRTAQGNKEASAKLLAGVSTREDIVNETLAKLGLDPRPYTVKDGVATMNDPAVRFRRQIDRAVIAEQQQPGAKPVGPDDVRRIADRIVIQETVQDPRSWYNPLRWVGDASVPTLVPAFELPGADDLAYTPSQVPPTYRDAALKKNPSLTADQILDAYNLDVKKRANAKP